MGLFSRVGLFWGDLRGDSHPDIKPYLDILLQHPHSKSNSWQMSFVGSQWGYSLCQYSQHCPGGLDQHQHQSEHCWRQLHLLTKCILVTAILKLWMYSLLTECTILDHCISIVVCRSKYILYCKDTYMIVCYIITHSLFGFASSS